MQNIILTTGIKSTHTQNINRDIKMFYTKRGGNGLVTG